MPSILSVNEIADGRDSSYDATTNDRTYTRVFRVITDSPMVGALAVRTADGLPRRGSIYATDTEVDLSARVKSIDPSQDSDNAKIWLVRVEYDSRVEDEPENPLERPPEISWGFAQFQRIAWRDVDGKAIVNSAGEYFDPPIEIDDSRPVLSIVRNEASFNPSLAIEYQDAVNSDSFMGFSAGQAKVSNITARSVREGDYQYWQVAYEFHFRRDGWAVRPLDQGRYSTGRVRIPEIDEDGNEIPDSHVIDPVPLDGNGQPIDNPGPDNCVFLEFHAYKRRAFSAFNF